MIDRAKRGTRAEPGAPVLSFSQVPLPFPSLPTRTRVSRADLERMYAKFSWEEPEGDDEDDGDAVTPQEER